MGHATGPSHTNEQVGMLCGTGKVRKAGRAHIGALAWALRSFGARVAWWTLPRIEGAADELQQSLPVRGHRRHVAAGGCLQGGQEQPGHWLLSSAAQRFVLTSGTGVQRAGVGNKIGVGLSFHLLRCRLHAPLVSVALARPIAVHNVEIA